MAVRRPLVRVAGRIVELPASDSLPGVGADWFGATAPDPAEYSNWFLPTGEWFRWDGTVWFQPLAAAAASTSQKKPYLWA